MLPRLQLFELTDQAWFPRTFRNLVTDYLRFVQIRFGLHQPVVPLLAEACRRAGSTAIVDLGSGGGGPITGLLGALAAEGIKPRVTLTDPFPNIAEFQRAAAESGGQISYDPRPVDARAVPSDLGGFRTMFNSFHHLSPPDALAVLRDAVRAREPIGVFEIADRRWRSILSLLFLSPLMVLATTPFIRPFTWRRLFWTYVVPVAPLATWWDGVISQFRAYSVTELQALTEQTEDFGYEWMAGREQIESSGGYITYLIGYRPKSDVDPNGRSDQVRSKFDVPR